MNYPGFVQLLNKYSSSGLKLIGFSCNQFGAQAPSSSECERAYFYHKLNATYDIEHNPVFDKVDVNGDKESSVYQYLKANDKSVWFLHDIKWNYEKFLIDGDGKVITRLRSPSSPLGFESKIKELLGVDEKEEILV